MTLSPPSALLGVQQPRVSSIPAAVSSTGAEAVELAESAGVMLFPWQRLALDAMLGERPDGSWACFEFGFLVARQNGKGEVLLARELAGLFLLGERLLLHSAHEFKTAKEAYLRIKAVIEGAPHLASRVKQFYQSNQETAVELKNGARLRFMARSRQSGRGFSAQTLLMDEAQEMSEQARGALMFTTSAQANPQLIYTGTVPTAETANSEVWTSVRERGQAGGDPQLGWMDYSAGEDGEVDLDDRRGWAQANPSLGHLIAVETIERERLATPDRTFAEERLSIWPAVDASKPQWLAVAEHVWRACAGDRRPGWLAGPVALSVEMSEDRSTSTVCAAGDDGGRPGVQVLASEVNGPWVVPLIVERCENAERPVSVVVVDPRSPAGSLIEPLRDAGVDVVECPTADLVKATGSVLDALRDEQVSFRSHPALEASVATARLRRYGEAHLFDRRYGTDPSVVIGSVLALWGAAQAPVAAPEPDFIVI